MFKRKQTEPAQIPVPATLPPLAGLEEYNRPDGGRPLRTWLWTLVAAAVVVLLVAYILVLGFMGIYDGLKDRALENQQIAQEHYALGLEYLQDGNHELAIAEFELALRHDSSLRDARDYLHQAKLLAKAEITPTSETRKDAAQALYHQSVDYYESGELGQAVALLEDLRGLDAEYQTENVETMLVKAHQQLGMNAVAENRLQDAATHFDTVLALAPGDEAAQEQLNLIDLYQAALSNWERDWSATIQALKGLYALAPGYMDVERRLHDAYVFRGQSLGQEASWCQAADQYAAAADVLPLETTVDARDDARIRCQATAEAPTPSPTSRATATSRVTSTPSLAATPTPRATAGSSSPILTLGQGKIAFTSFDAIRRQHDVYIVDLAQGNARLLRANASQPAFSPQGSRLAFRNLDPLHLGLAILDLRSDEISELTDHTEDSTPAWSPDALQIVFASNKHGDRKWRVYVISPGEIRGEGEEWVFGRMPAWSDDGSRIAYHGCDQRGDNCGIWIMQPGGFQPARLTTDASDTAPAWSPDGSQVAFISARDGNWEIYVADIATGQERRLSDSNATDVAPIWSPDGRQIAFLSNRQGAWAIYILDLRSGQAQKLIATGDAYPDPLNERLSWLP
jgi:Tfp pilus assembly protein PilF